MVGDILKLVDGEKVPADLIIMSTGEPSGVGYCQTSTLDGEMSLKPK